jgi:hypothetical protein
VALSRSLPAEWNNWCVRQITSVIRCRLMSNLKSAGIRPVTPAAGAMKHRFNQLFLLLSSLCLVTLACMACWRHHVVELNKVRRA